MEIKARLTADIKEAMKGGLKDKLAILRLISAEFKRIEVDKRIEIDDEIAIEVLTKMVSQRLDSKQQFLKAERLDLAKQEEFELGIIRQYLPEPMTEEEVAKIIEEAVVNLKISEVKELGKLMTYIRPSIIGRFDMSLVANMAKKVIVSS